MASTHKIYYRLILILSVIGVFVFHFQEMLHGSVFYGPYKDNIFWNLPQMAAASRLLLSGELPLYDPVGFFPLYQNPIFSFLYPLNFLWFDGFGTMDEAMKTVYFLVLLHYGLILLATYFLLRTLKLSVAASLFGAFVYCFSVALSIVASWPHALFSQVWAIFATAALIRFLYDDNWPIWGTAFALCGSLMVLASPSGSLIFFLYIWIVIFLFALWDKDAHARSLRWYKQAGLALAACLLISAPALLPYILHAGENIRWITLLDGHTRPLYGNVKMPLEAALPHQSTISDLVNVLWPIGRENAKGYYVGAIGVFFMLLAFLDKQNWRARLFKSHVLLLGWSLFSIAGSNLGMLYLNYRLPGLGDLRESWFFSYIFLFFAAVVAAYGAQSLIAGRLRGWLVGTVAASLVVALTVLNHSETRPYLNATYWFDIGALLLIAGAFWYGRARSRSGDAPGLVALALILGLAVSFGFRLHPQSPPDAIAQSPVKDTPRVKVVMEAYDRLNGMENMALYRTISDLKPMGVAGSSRGIDGMSALYDNVRAMRVAGSPHPREIFEAYNGRFGFPGFYALHGVKYFISDKPSYAQSADYKELFRIGDVAVYENAAAVPEFFIAYHVSGFHSTAKDYWAKIRRFGDVSNAVFVMEDDRKRVEGIPQGEGRLVAGEGLRIVKNRANTKVVSVTLERPGLLILNEHFSPSWSMKVDGASVDPIRANQNQVGVVLAAGTHEVEFSYMPRELGALLYGFAAGLLILLVQLIRQRMKSVAKLVGRP